MKLDFMRIKDTFNKLSGIPIELDLSEYRKHLRLINKQCLTGETDASLQKRSSGLMTRARKGTPLNELLTKAYALVREASRRTLVLRPFDVQVMAGIAMHRGRLVEMQTGEGKTLAAVFPAYLNALSGRGVHVHTFNDYLARRDAAWMGPIYRFLGLRVGCIQERQGRKERQNAYNADITYSTAKEAGFDFLRDNLCYESDDQVHRPFHFAIVDEADSLLIDEARVPLVIAGMTEEVTANSFHPAEIVRNLKPEIDYYTDDGKRNVFLTDKGVKRIEAVLGCGNLFQQKNFEHLTRINLALHAEALLQRDVDYIVRSGAVEIVDEFTGRVVKDRHWPDGLQAAVEAKEKLNLQKGGTILGSITLQHFMRLYPKLCGMTATARSAASELKTFYDLKVVVISPNRPCIRRDLPDIVFTDKKAKSQALIAEIVQTHSTGRPVLVGTASVEESEKLAEKLKKSGIKCCVLNAKNNELEAGIIARAGAPGAVTISTNMAGRGTDIKLGGNDEQERDSVVSLGGLYVIGTNRHESIRIDRQLRGRAGRQGDPGESRFFISLEDNLIERYRIDRLIPSVLRSKGKSKVIDHPIVNREIARGQRIVEGQNFEIRKTLWEYSSLVEHHRKRMYQHRCDVLTGNSRKSMLAESSPEKYALLSSQLGKERMSKLEQQITLFHIDRGWSEHLAKINDVRESIHLVSVAGESPLNEFHRIIVDAFLELEQIVDDRITETFNALEITADGVDLEKKNLKGPSSTWTYLVNDNQFGSWVKMLNGSNIGFTAGAAAAYNGPLFIALSILRRFHKKKK